MANPIQWLAYYADGETLAQYDGETENRYTDIDRTRLAAFALVRDGAPMVMVHFDEPDKRLIYRRRVFLRPGVGPEVFYLVGWQMSVRGENVQSICVMSESGALDVIGKWRDDHPLFGGVEYLPCEEE
jgi:hypothetical protein